MKHGRNRQTNVLVAGTGEEARRMGSLFASSGETERVIAGYVELPSGESESPSDGRGEAGDSGVAQSVAEMISGNAQIDEVFIADPGLPTATLFSICLPLLEKGVVVRVASPSFSVIRQRLGAADLDGVPLVGFHPPQLRGWRLQVKRALDVASALVSGVVLLPMFLVAAILVKLSSPGPVLFKQKRVGKGGKEFTFYKFRSMVSGDDSRHKEYLKEFVANGREAAVDSRGRKVYKIMDDPRITPFGHFLRRTSLDEFPQLVNVLKGEMSLVGPRPCLAYEWALYDDWQKKRLSVTPGLTGLWQVTGRSNVSFQEMVILDLFYVCNWSFWRDLKLIFQTVPVIFLGRGAH